MNALSHHIECLLLDHPCVVVPQFGAFVTMGSPSVRVEHEALFFPPLRVVRFNPNVLEDDGLLVQSVRSEMNCSESEAKYHVQSLVLHLRQKLLAEGQVDFGSIGVFSQDEDGHVAFSSCQAGAVTPSYFGLDAFSMLRLSEIQHKRKPRKAVHRPETSPHESHFITIRISRRALRRTLMAAAVILVSVLFYNPVAQKVVPPQEATILPTPVAVSATPAEAKSAKPLAPTKPAAEPARKTVQPAAPVAAEAPKAEATASLSPYCIVLASAVSQRNAENFVERLQKQGYKNARIYNNGKMNRVILDGYASEADAARSNAELHKQSKDFATSWVMKL